MTTNWQLSGDYFENCNCSVVCPCLISPAPPLTSRPTEGVCDVALAFHIDKGNYGTVALDGLNLALIAHTPGPMADGNWTIAIYIDERASDEQAAALGAVFGGAEGGPMAAFAPLIAHKSRRQESADNLPGDRQDALGRDSGGHEYVGRAAAEPT